MIHSIDSEPIDAVYLWVDGQDGQVRKQLQQARLECAGSQRVRDAKAFRYRNNGELRYSLRSLVRYAPWIRTIYLVTNGQRPRWLSTNNNSLRVITHQDIFANSAALPSFNSHSIEWQLHRIEGLSRRFLYLNDDLFLGQPSQREDYLCSSHAQHIYLGEDRLEAVKRSATVHDRAYQFTLDLLRERWPGQGARPRFEHLPAHVPQLYDREVLSLLAREFSRPLSQLQTHRIRSANDLVMRLVYFYYQLKVCSSRDQHVVHGLTSPSRKFVMARLRPDHPHTQEALRAILRLKPKYYCLNDEIEDSDAEAGLLSHVRELISIQFPLASKYERSAPSFYSSVQREYWNQRLHRHPGLHGVGSVKHSPALTHWAYQLRKAVFARALRHVQPVPVQARVLDVGTGTGFYLDLWQGHGFTNLTATDISDVAVARVSRTHPRVRCVRTDIARLAQGLGGQRPEPDRFDLISCMDVLFHVTDETDYRCAIEALSVCLKPGGWLLLTENLIPGKTKSHGTYWRSRSREEIFQLLESNGLKLVGEFPQFVLLGSPVALSQDWPARLREWSVRALAFRPLAYAAGALAYASDRFLTRWLSTGPSTKLLLLRKPEASAKRL